MQNHLNFVSKWSESNLMKINWKKIKAMVIAPAKFKQSCLSLEYNGVTIEHVSSFKLLGVSVNTALRWNDHIDTIQVKAAKRLYFIKQLRRAGLSSDHLLQYYKTVIRPVVEYACPLWHSSVSAEQSRSLESIQRRALRIITPVITTRKDACLEFNIQTLNDRRYFLAKNSTSSIVIRMVSFTHTYLIAKATLSKLRYVTLSKYPHLKLALQDLNNR